MRVKESIEGCTKEYKNHLEKFLHEYRGVLKKPKGVPPNGDVENEIQLFPDFPLLNIGLYIHFVLEANELNKKLQQFLEQGVIRPSTSPCGSTIIIVTKKDGAWRTCIYYRALINITLKNRYPLHRIDDLLDQLQHLKYVRHIVIHVLSLMSTFILSRVVRLILGRKRIDKRTSP